MGVYFYLMATSDDRGVARRCKLPCDCKYKEMNYLTPTLLMSTVRYLSPFGEVMIPRSFTLSSARAKLRVCTLHGRMGWIPDGLAVLFTLVLITCGMCCVYLLCSTCRLLLHLRRNKMKALPFRHVRRAGKGKLKIRPSSVIVPPIRVFVTPAAISSPTTPSSVILSIGSSQPFRFNTSNK